METGIVASDQHITARTFPLLIFRMVPVQKLAVARYSTASATSHGSPSLASRTPLCSSSLCCAREIGAELPRVAPQNLDQGCPGHIGCDHLHRASACEQPLLN